MSHIWLRAWAVIIGRRSQTQWYTQLTGSGPEEWRLASNKSVRTCLYRSRVQAWRRWRSSSVSCCQIFVVTRRRCGDSSSASSTACWSSFSPPSSLVSSAASSAGHVTPVTPTHHMTPATMTSRRRDQQRSRSTLRHAVSPCPSCDFPRLKCDFLLTGYFSGPGRVIGYVCVSGQ